jgi:hypothetical protein
MSAANTGPLTMFPSTSGTASTAAPTTTTATVSVGAKATVTVSARRISASDLQNAVYAHIQAVRALGKTKITPEEIARALGLPLSTVEGSLSALQSKGVKVLHHG